MEIAGRKTAHVKTAFLGQATGRTEELIQPVAVRVSSLRKKLCIESSGFIKHKGGKNIEINLS